MNNNGIHTNNRQDIQCVHFYFILLFCDKCLYTGPCHTLYEYSMCRSTQSTLHYIHASISIFWEEFILVDSHRLAPATATNAAADASAEEDTEKGDNQEGPCSTAHNYDEWQVTICCKKQNKSL